MGKLGYYIVDIQFNPIVFSMVLIIFCLKCVMVPRSVVGKKNLLIICDGIEQHNRLMKFQPNFSGLSPDFSVIAAWYEGNALQSCDLYSVVMVSNRRHYSLGLWSFGTKWVLRQGTLLCRQHYR